MASLREIGQALKEAREEKGLTLEDVSHRTRITVRHLLALEEGNESDLPETFYIRGFLKKYADAVGLPPADVADAYKQAPVPVTRPPVRSNSAMGPIVYYGAVGVLFVGVIALAWWFQPRVSVVEAPAASPTPSPTATPSPKPTLGPPAPTPRPTPTPKATATPLASPSPSPSPAPSDSPVAGLVPGASPSADPSASPAASGSPAASPGAGPTAGATPNASGVTAVALTLAERSWVEVIVDGRRVYEGVLSKGTKRVYKGRTVELSAGNSGGVRLNVDGRDRGAMGAHGEVATRKFTAD